VLLVVDDPQRQALLKGCLQKHLPGCRIEMVHSYYDAMSRATRLQTDLLVLDLSLDSVLVPALKRFLARAAPQALVHVFDDSQDNMPGAEAGCNSPSILQLKQTFSILAGGHPALPH
jgi:CheY-like chemotaxis protein